MGDWRFQDETKFVFTEAGVSADCVVKSRLSVWDEGTQDRVDPET